MGAIQVQRVRYTHEAIIERIIDNPSISQGELAAEFGYTQAWISIIVNSDAFKHQLKERKGEIVDPHLRASVEERLSGLANRSLDKLLDRLDSQVPLKTSDLIQMAKLGVGDKNVSRSPVGTQNNLYVVQLPAPETSRESWLSSAQGVKKIPEVVDISFVNPEP
jgi:hypothetical protein